MVEPSSLTFEFTPDGVYVRMDPTAPERDYGRYLAALRSLAGVEVDYRRARRAFRAPPGERHRIAAAPLGGAARVEVDDSGEVRLTVHRTAAGERPSYEQLCAFVAAALSPQIDHRALRSAWRACAGRPCSIGRVPPRGATDPRLSVRVDGDGRTATLTLHAPPPDLPPVDRWACERALARAGVTVGVDEAALRDLLAQRVYERPRVVARAVEPEPGAPGRLLPRIDLGEGLEALLADVEAGRAPQWEMWLRTLTPTYVSRGAVLALIEPTRPGRPGLRVDGRPLPCAPIASFQPAFDPATVSLDETGALRARCGGQPISRDGRIGLRPLSILAAAAVPAGPVAGTLIVQGDLEGEDLVVGGDLEVWGDLRARRLWTEGALIVRGRLVVEDRGEVGGSLLAERLTGGVWSVGGHVLARDMDDVSLEAAGAGIVLEGVRGTLRAGRFIDVGWAAGRAGGGRSHLAAPLEGFIRIRRGAAPPLRLSLGPLWQPLREEVGPARVSCHRPARGAPRLVRSSGP